MKMLTIGSNVNHLFSLFKAGIAAIPIIGGSISSLIGDYFPTEKKVQSDKFPKLNIAILKMIAKRIVNKYPTLKIESIKLYRYHSNYFKNISVKYAMVIEIDDGILKNQKLKRSFEKLQFSTGWLSTVPDGDSSKDLGIDKSFADIYIEEPPKNHIEEWAFYAKASKDTMPIGIMINEPSLKLH